jgi:hypothetical protein
MRTHPETARPIDVVRAGVRAFAERLERATAPEREQTIAEYGGQASARDARDRHLRGSDLGECQAILEFDPGTQVLTAHARIDAGTVRGNQDLAGAPAPCGGGARGTRRSLRALALRTTGNHARIGPARPNAPPRAPIAAHDT